jgi:hypothetical protein
LLSQKEAFLNDLNSGNIRGWTIAMGNEAGGTSRTSFPSIEQRRLTAF